MKKIIMLIAAFCSFGVFAADFNVCEFGAKADGKTDNTFAFQSAIDACAKSGGRVVVPAASKPYISYTLYLKSNVEFHIAEGAIVKGGPDGLKYPEFAPTPLWGWNRTPRLDKRAFFYTLAATNVAITGKGVIDGSSEFFKMWSPARKRFWRTDDLNLPGRCLLFVRCNNVRLEDFTVLHTTGWNLWLLGCDNVNARGVTLDTDVEYPNGDGFHISSCRNVLVENCNISSSDDCFAIRSHQELLPVELAACEKITVRDTVCQSSGASFCRFGWSTDFRVSDVLFDNVTCSNCWTGVSIHLPNLRADYLEPPRGHGLPPLPLEKCRPFEVERIRFQNCRITAETHPVQFVIGNALKTRPVSFIRNMLFKNVDFFSTKGPEFVVWAENNISDITFEDVRFNIAKSPYEKIVPADSLFFDNCRDIRFNNCLWNYKNDSVAIAPPLPDDYVPPFKVSNLRTDSWIGEGMVFQRGRMFEVTGDGKPGDKITVKINGITAAGKVNRYGRWSATLPPFKAGGPYVMEIVSSSGEKLELKDMYAGDVWICSGQSNMEMPVWSTSPFYRLDEGRELAAAANDSKLRLFLVGNSMALFPLKRFKGNPSWKGATSAAAVEPFSSVAYYFGMELRKRYPDVPIGLVDSSWGGTRIEPWIPEGALMAGDYSKELNRLSSARRDDITIPEAERESAAYQAWLKAFEEDFKKNCKFGEWKKGDRSVFPTLTEPGVLEFRFVFDIPQSEVADDFVFHVEAVDDADITYLNGREIGATMPTRGAKNTWLAKRDYRFKTDRAGRQEIVLRGYSYNNELYLKVPLYVKNLKTGRVIDLSESQFEERILYRANIAKLGGPRPIPPEAKAPDASQDRTLPSSIFNAMIAPLKGMPVKGTIWFQGCANGRESERYHRLGVTLANAWRSYFRSPKMSFLVAQIGAFKRESPRSRLPDDFWKEMKPDDVGFSLMREAQYKLGTEPLGGIVCCMDIGDHSNIHFKNKRDVGRRLAREAFRVTYGEKGFPCGPSIERAEIRGSRVIVKVKDAGKGLVVDGDGKVSPRVFSLAGKDGKLHWATAKLIGADEIEVSSAQVPEPREVRYAFTGFAGGNLVRRKGDGLPLFPFRTKVMKAGEFAYSNHPRCTLIVHPGNPAKTGKRVLVWFHGGGLVLGDKVPMPKSLYSKDYVVVSANYRFLSEAKVEEIWDDAAKAVAWVFDNIEKFGGDPKKIFVAGHSAGGYLTCMVGFNPALLAKYGRKNTDLRGIIPISAQVTEHYGVRHSLKDPDHHMLPKINPRAPLYYIGNKLPPVEIVCGDRKYDVPCRVIENELLVASLRAMNKRDVEFYEIPGADHGGCLEPGLGIAENFMILHENGCPEVKAKVDFSKPSKAKIRPMHAVGQPPMLGYTGTSMFHYLTEANIPYARLHDVGGKYGGNIFVDIPNIFRNFDADENDPANYDFGFTDVLLLGLQKAGVKPIYRLGVTIENAFNVSSLRIDPPKDFAKWARICERIIAHYNEGWANGYKMGIEYWQIWNEPEESEPKEGYNLKPGQRMSMMWNGSKEQYFELYDITSRHLKKRFGDTIKIGGPSATGCFGKTPAADDMSYNARAYRKINSWNRDFVRFVAEKKCPFDFYSFHSYRSVKDTMTGVREVEGILKENGLSHVEMLLDEWNSVNMSQEYGEIAQSAHYAAMLIALQVETQVDIACFYDAGVNIIGPRVNYKGMFTPYCRPNIGYWPFKAFGFLYGLGAEVPVEFEGGKPDGVYAVAAKDDKGNVGVLLANIGNSVRIKLEGLPEGVQAYTINDTRDMEAFGFENGELHLPAHNVIFLQKKSKQVKKPDLPRVQEKK